VQTRVYGPWLKLGRSVENGLSAGKRFGGWALTLHSCPERIPSASIPFAKFQCGANAGKHKDRL
jgi:hypothetical protein